MPDGRYTDVITRLRPDAAEPGEIVHLDGRVLGRHPASCISPSGSGGVSALRWRTALRDPARCRREARCCRTKGGAAPARCLLSGVKWLGAEPLSEQPVPVFARIRSSASQLPPRSVLKDRGPGSRCSMANMAFRPDRPVFSMPGWGPHKNCWVVEPSGPPRCCRMDQLRLIGMALQIRRMSMQQQGLKLVDIDNGDVRRAYRRWAPVYDATFGKLVEAACGRPQGWSIPIMAGFSKWARGTGLALPQYKPDLKVTGIDLSPDMLQRAGERVVKAGLRNYRGIARDGCDRARFP